MVARQKAAVLVLALVAGFVDSVIATAVLGIAVAHVSGDSKNLAEALSRIDLHKAFTATIPVAWFVCGVAFGGFFMEIAVRSRVSRRLAIALAVESCLLAMTAIAAEPPAGSWRTSGELVWVLGLPAAAMGIQTSAADQVRGRRVRTTYISGMLTRFAQASVRWALWIRDALRAKPDLPFVQALRSSLRLHSADRALLLAAIWFSWVTGAAAGAVAEHAFGIEAVALPIVLLILLALADARHPFEFASPLPQEPDPRATT